MVGKVGSMRSFEIPGTMLFIQPLKTTWDAPLRSRTTSVGVYRGHTNLFCPDTRVYRLWPLPLALAFGQWQEGRNALQEEDREWREEMRSEWTRYNVVSDPVTLEEYIDARTSMPWSGDSEPTDEDIMGYVQMVTSKWQEPTSV